MVERIEICIGDGLSECTSRAKYVRHTQFAGSHPLCLDHAREDKNFLINDSYECWEVLPDPIEVIAPIDNPWELSHDL